LTNTPTNTPTVTPTLTLTNTPTLTPTLALTSTPTLTPTAVATATPQPGGGTPTPGVQVVVPTLSSSMLALLALALMAAGLFAVRKL
jgi:hypothetical protein